MVRSQEYNEPDSHAQEPLDSFRAVLSFDDQDGQQPILKLGFGQDELENAPHRRNQASSRPFRVYGRPDKESVRRHHTSGDVLGAQRGRQGLILDATEESMVRLGKRQSQTLRSPKLTATCCTDSRPTMTKMVSFSSDKTASATGPEPTAAAAAAAAAATSTTTSTEAMFESLSWLERSEDLDLRLALDGQHFDLGDQHASAPTKQRGPSFRRRLSISKLPFGNRMPVTVNGPPSKDASARNSVAASPQPSAPGSPVQSHARRRSRALSLLTSNRQPISAPAPDPLTFVDPAAAHYQDPDARMKLRVYLASAHKFDEAIEFGFPSIEDVQDKAYAKGHKRAASQQESGSALDKRLPRTPDDGSSIYSDDDDDDDHDDDGEASSTEPDSPRTPLTMEKPLLLKATKENHDEECHMSTTTSREMTLRMTLTRPDLRANEEQIYGWQKMSSGRHKSSQTKDEPHLAVSLLRDGHSKESIERQFAALDQEGLFANDDGVMKRFWNRVRRA
ncbi:hypothetical protein E4U43_003980 [Claviceps pusilla]|uniref:Mucin n=1 Tax=Claviceps pusilla TaxID=123648 RepID=A0A9P7NHN4_9HYPO|nr:hypothetical protein E4U43_003980 [Claviceps pusilla]